MLTPLGAGVGAPAGKSRQAEGWLRRPHLEKGHGCGVGAPCKETWRYCVDLATGRASRAKGPRQPVTERRGYSQLAARVRLARQCSCRRSGALQRAPSGADLDVRGLRRQHDGHQQLKGRAVLKRDLGLGVQLSQLGLQASNSGRYLLAHGRQRCMLACVRACVRACVDAPMACAELMACAGLGTCIQNMQQVRTAGGAGAGAATGGGGGGDERLARLDVARQ